MDDVRARAMRVASHMHTHEMGRRPGTWSTKLEQCCFLLHMVVKEPRCCDAMRCDAAAAAAARGLWPGAWGICGDEAGQVAAVAAFAAFAASRHIYSVCVCVCVCRPILGKLASTLQLEGTHRAKRDRSEATAVAAVASRTGRRAASTSDVCWAGHQKHPQPSQLSPSTQTRHLSPEPVQALIQIQSDWLLLLLPLPLPLPPGHRLELPVTPRWPPTKSPPMPS